MNGDVNGWHGAKKGKNDFYTIDKTPFATSFSLVLTSVVAGRNQCKETGFEKKLVPDHPIQIDLGNEAEEQDLSSSKRPHQAGQ